MIIVPSVKAITVVAASLVDKSYGVPSVIEMFSAERIGEAGTSLISVAEADKKL